MLDLVRLSPRPLFPPGGIELYRQIALLTEMSAGREVLDAGCGPGIPLEYFVREHRVQGSGVDFDPRMVEIAEERIRSAGLSDRLQVQQASIDRLPYRDRVFDVTVGELGLTARAEPAAAVRELVRVTKPGGHVVLVQLVWKAPVDEDRREILADHLGTHPLMLVEWKRLLRGAGVVDLHTEDWTDGETAFRPQVRMPFPDFAELFSVGEKFGILRRAWGRWGWRGVKVALEREREVHRLLTRERVLGLDLLMGRRGADVEAPPSGSGPAEEAIEDVPEPVPESGPGPEPSPFEVDGDEEEDEEGELTGLPLFARDDER